MVINAAPTATEQSAKVQEVTLAIRTTGQVSRLQSFVRQASEKLHARVTRVVGSWEETCVTLKPGETEAADADSVLNALALMPEVGEAKQTKRTLDKQCILVTLKPAGEAAEVPPAPETA